MIDPFKEPFCVWIPSKEPLNPPCEAVGNLMFWPPGSVAALGPKKGVAFVAERMTQLVELFGFHRLRRVFREGLSK